jgi:hypothetical protein
VHQPVGTLNAAPTFEDTRVTLLALMTSTDRRSGQASTSVCSRQSSHSGGQTARAKAE